jgi:Spy/CpxP family protein refolding chaperone
MEVLTMKRALLLTLGLAAAGLIVLAITVEARGPFGGGFRVERMAKALNLSDAQAKDLKALQDNTFKQSLEIRKNMDLKRHELRDLMAEEKPDRAKIAAKIDEITSLRAEMMKIRVMTRLDMRAMLTDEQMAKLQELRQERMQNRKNARGWGHGQGQGFRKGGPRFGAMGNCPMNSPGLGGPDPNDLGNAPEPEQTE